MTSASRRFLLIPWSLQLAAVVVSGFLAPIPGRLVSGWLRFDLSVPGVEGYGLMLFNMMGLWPLAFIALLAGRGGEWRPRPAPFLAGAFVGGAFILGYWFLLRNRVVGAASSPSRKGRIVRSAAFIAIAAAAVALVAWSLPRGDAAAFVALARSGPFVPLVILDFLWMILIFTAEARRIGRESRLAGTNVNVKK